MRLRPSVRWSHLIYIKDVKPLGTREPMLKTIQCSADILLNVNVNSELSSHREIWMFICLSLRVTYHFGGYMMNLLLFTHGQEQPFII